MVRNFANALGTVSSKYVQCPLTASILFRYIHPAGYKVLMRFANETRVEILVDDSWTSKDVVVLHGAMNTFRRTLRRISLDAPIVELVSIENMSKAMMIHV